MRGPWRCSVSPESVNIQPPRTAGPLAFHADFFLVIMAAHATLFDNGYAGTLPFHAWQPPFFDADAYSRAFEAAIERAWKDTPAG